jgi:carbon-monoxide dehydrogenase medium subunit
MSPNPSPGLPEFDYLRPASLAEASRFLADHVGEARPFSGGTDTFVRMRDGAWRDKYVVDVKHLDGTEVFSFDLPSGLRIGASVSMNRVIAAPEVKQHYPVLAEAARTVASYQLRSRATIVGNVCNASPAGDTIGACLVLDGALQVHGLNGLRTEPLSSLYVGPGKTTLKPGDIALALILPPPPPNYVAKYIKLGRNKLGDLAIVGITALGYPDSSAASGYRFRLVLASVAPVPLRPLPAEAILAEQPLNAETITAAAQAAMEACTPIDDTRGSARYRKLMVRNLTQQALTQVWGAMAGRQ